MDFSNLGLLSGLFGGGGAPGLDPMAAAKGDMMGPMDAKLGMADGKGLTGGGFTMPQLNPAQTAQMQKYAMSMLAPPQAPPALPPIHYARAPGLLNQAY